MGDLPLELQGIAAKLNELLGRLEVSFARERRFTSDAAHELRTPLAELKAMTELGALAGGIHGGARQGNDPVHCRTRGLLDKLSQLARADAAVGARSEAVDLAATVRDCLERFAGPIQERRLQFDRHVAEETWQTDPVLWRSILDNVVGNSVAYAPEGSSITVRATPSEFSVTNEAPDFESGDTGICSTGSGANPLRAATASIRASGCRWSNRAPNGSAVLAALPSTGRNSRFRYYGKCEQKPSTRCTFVVVPDGVEHRDAVAGGG